jgi:hypothetical protein
MSCDICGKTDRDLQPLLDSYKTPEITHVCSECLSIVNKHNSKLIGVALNIKRTWLKRFMENLRGKR